MSGKCLANFRREALAESLEDPFLNCLTEGSELHYGFVSGCVYGRRANDRGSGRHANGHDDCAH